VTDVNTCGQCGADAGLLMLHRVQHKGLSVQHSFTEVCCMRHCLPVITVSTLMLRSNRQQACMCAAWDE